MKIISEIKYYQILSKLQQDFIEASPCDHDITHEQIMAHRCLEHFKKNYMFDPTIVSEQEYLRELNAMINAGMDTNDLKTFIKQRIKKLEDRTS